MALEERPSNTPAMSHREIGWNMACPFLERASLSQGGPHSHPPSIVIATEQLAPAFRRANKRTLKNRTLSPVVEVFMEHARQVAKSIT